MPLSLRWLKNLCMQIDNLRSTNKMSPRQNKQQSAMCKLPPPFERLCKVHHYYHDHATVSMPVSVSQVASGFSIRVTSTRQAPKVAARIRPKNRPIASCLCSGANQLSSCLPILNVLHVLHDTRTRRTTQHEIVTLISESHTFSFSFIIHPFDSQTQSSIFFLQSSRSRLLLIT